MRKSNGDAVFVLLLLLFLLSPGYGYADDTCPTATTSTSGFAGTNTNGSSFDETSFDDTSDEDSSDKGLLFDRDPSTVPPTGGGGADPKKKSGMTYTDPKTGKTIAIKDFKDIRGVTWIQTEDGGWRRLPPDTTPPPKPKWQKDDDGTITDPDGKKSKPGDKGYDDADAELAKQKAAEERAAKEKADKDAADKAAADKKAARDAADKAAQAARDALIRRISEIERNKNATAAEIAEANALADQLKNMK